MKHGLAMGVCLAGLLVGGCNKKSEPAENASPPRSGSADPEKVKPTATGPTAKDAATWIEAFEAERRQLLVQRERADWVRSNFITHDTEAITAKAEQQLMAFTAKGVQDVKQFAGVKADGPLARKLKLVRLSATVPAPGDTAKQKELSEVSGRLASAYGKGKYCAKEGECQTLGDLSKTLATSRDPSVLREAWAGWRAATRGMRGDYTRFVTLANEGAKEMGFTDLGALWKSKYDMEPEAFAADMDRLWTQVRPLYEQLHCYTRGKLSEKYGVEVVPATGAMPAHVLGNMWAQDWSYLDWLLMPGSKEGSEAGSPVTAALVAKKVDAKGMAKYAEDFFVSLGLRKLPETFWTRSLFERPKDREVECHASAWPVDWYDDLRIKMCIEITDEDFNTLHHELGHLYYYDAYKDQPTLFADSANDGFHEAIGDAIALSVTPGYLKQINLVPESSQDDVQVLLRRALEKVAFLPFGLLVDRWRWQVFSGEVGADGYNAAWWKLREKYQGIKAPIVRTESDFDPGGKYHVPSNVPYTRYFIAHILQFQLHRALCRKAGHKGPLHQCSIYGSKEAGTALNELMAVGLSKPWPEALKIATGEDAMDASALIDYFQPLMVWLEKQNEGRTCGW
ncbi:MAG: peptidyl-dipeptidase A [Myxococcota bacterium]|jgi:peptidyl-dipeptidase A